MDGQEQKGQDGGQRISRRHFLELVGIGSVALTAAGAAVLTVEYLSPNVLLEPPMKFKAGPVSAYPPDSVTKLKDQKVYIIRAREGYLYALTDVCTHLGCITNWDPDQGIIACPCHGSKFDREGNVIHGPAPKSLPRYALSLNDQGQLVVDKSVVVDSDAVLKI